MKPYEFVLLIVNLCLGYAGWYWLTQGNIPFLGVLCLTLACIILIAYLYLAKFRPTAVARQSFLEAVDENGFIAVKEKAAHKTVADLMKCFPNFADFYLGVINLHVREDETGIYFAGRYFTSGKSINFGFFLVGVLDTPE
ncbi:MAG: hypothetical protein MPJ50_19785, partial [Pirellulales bacterium]|nr:hypothetical protein [Pirellulales bacterium]